MIEPQKYAEIRCPKMTYVPKFNKRVPCMKLIVKVTPGSSGEGFCWLKDPSNNMSHGTFLFEIDPGYVPPQRNIIKVKKP